MADIFVSYSSQDRERIASLVEILEAEGWTVWWDRDLVAGPDFDRRIEDELEAAKCVVVAWSKAAVDSRWCRAEASDGLDRQMLVPLRLDDVRPPLAFRNAQTASLLGWPGDRGELNAFLAGVRECLGVGIPDVTSGTPASAAPARHIWMISAVVALIVAVAIGWFNAFRPFGNDEITSQSAGSIEVASVLPNSVAVLPFENLSPDPDNAYFAAGIHEETLNQLGKIKDLSVIARTTMTRYADSDKSIPEIGKELNVTAVMEGSVRYAGARVRITAQLIDVTTGVHLWSEAYDRKLEDIFAIQSDIALNITDAMKAEFKLEERQSIAAIPTNNLEAYSAYVKGLALLNQLPPRIVESMAEFETAISLDQEFADALATKALVHVAIVRLQTGSGMTPKLEAESVQKAKALAQRALNLDSNQAVAHITLALAADVERRWEDALSHAQRAYETSPNSSYAAYIYGELLANIRGADEAIPFLDRAIALDPLNPNLPFYSVSNMMVNERIADAWRYAQLAVAAAPEAYASHLSAAWVAVVGDNAVAAASLMKAAEERAPSQINPSMRVGFIQVFELLGQRDAADREFQKLKEQDNVSDNDWFRAYLARGERDNAIEHLHAMIDNGFPAMGIRFVALHWDSPEYDLLRDDRRFDDTLDKLGVSRAVR